MSYEENPWRPMSHPPGLRHYHGDALRGLFVLAALIMILAISMGAILPLSTFGTVTFAVVLMIVAGITNPAQNWINWVNVILAVVGTLIFGMNAVAHYRAGGTLLDISYISVEALGLIFLFAIYFSVKTVRGLALRSNLS